MKLSSKDGRKYTFTLLAFAGSIVMLCVGKISGGEWVTVVGILSGMFGITNSIEKFGKGGRI